MTNPLSVSVFCGSAANVAPVYRDTAQRLGTALAQAGVKLVYGGEKAGLLGVLSNACIAAGGQICGILPEGFKTRGLGNEAVKDIHLVRDLHERKSVMLQKSDAFIVLPGGLGTLDEAVDALATKYGGAHRKPVVFINTDGYYMPLFVMLDHMIERGFAPATHKGLFYTVETPEEAVAWLRAQNG